MNKNKDVDNYIKRADAKARPMLRKIRRIIKSAAPKAEEKISYGIPLYKYYGMLVAFGAFKDHVSLFALTEISKKFRKEMKKYKTSAGTIQFPLGKPVPAALIKKMVKMRMKQKEEKRKKLSK